MASVGIIANPASGKDIRRLVSKAWVISNQKKVNIVCSVLVGLHSTGIKKVYVMPDHFGIGSQAVQSLRGQIPELSSRVELLDLELSDSAFDSINAAEKMNELGINCLIVLGGDGTIRAASKGCGDVPLVPLSTGTNNVIPVFIEGVTAGLCAGYVASVDETQISDLCSRSKRLEVWVNDELVDISLVDISVIAGNFTGARAVWEASAVRQIAVTQASPTSIGLSAVVGMVWPISDEDEYGGLARITAGNNHSKLVSVPIGPSLVETIGGADFKKMELGVSYPIVDERPLVLALDGERELVLNAGDSACLVLKRNGPLVVNIERAMLQAASTGFFVSS